MTKPDNDWSSQPRAVYSGEAMERELDALFPVDIGVKAILERQRQRNQMTKPPIARVRRLLDEAMSALAAQKRQAVKAEVQGVYGMGQAEINVGVRVYLDSEIAAIETKLEEARQIAEGIKGYDATARE